VSKQTQDEHTDSAGKQVKTVASSYTAHDHFTLQARDSRPNKGGKHEFDRGDLKRMQALLEGASTTLTGVI